MNKDEPTPTQKPQAPQSSKKVFDVMRPGKAMASPNSRPMISAHKAQVKDDMFVPGADSRIASGNPFEEKTMMSHKGSKKISTVPPQGEDKSVKAEDTPAAEEQGTEAPVEMTKSTEEQAPMLPANFPDDDDDDEPVSVTTPEPVAAAIAEPETPEPPHSEDIALAPDEPAEQSPTLDDTKSEQDIIASVAAQTEPTDEIDLEADGPDTDQSPAPDVLKQDGPMSQDDLLAATGAPVIDHAFVSHHKVRAKWWEWFAIFLMILLLALVALNFLIDADVIKTSLDIPHTNLIK